LTCNAGSTNRLSRQRVDREPRIQRQKEYSGNCSGSFERNSETSYPTLTRLLTEYSTKGYIWGRPIQPLLDSLPTSPIAPTAKGFDLILLSDLVFNHSQVRSIIPHSVVQQAHTHWTPARCPAYYMRKYINVPCPIRICATSRTHSTSILHAPPPASRSS
jgi:hypothetical protein